MARNDERWPIRMTPETAGEYLDCSASKITQLINDGVLHAYQEGSRSTRYLHRDDLEAYAAWCREEARKEAEAAHAEEANSAERELAAM